MSSGRGEDNLTTVAFENSMADLRRSRSIREFETELHRIHEMVSGYTGKVGGLMIYLNHITLRRGGRALLQNFELEVVAGEAVQLAGPNGVGKSSLMRVCAGLSDDYEGEVVLPARAERLYIGHRYGLTEPLSAVENLRYLLALKDQYLPESELVSALAEFKLGESMFDRVSTLSEGQRKRIALSRLNFSRQALWLLDEAFSALDQEGMHTLTALCSRHVEGGGALLFTSHQAIALSVPVRTIELTG